MRKLPEDNNDAENGTPNRRKRKSKPGFALAMLLARKIKVRLTFPAAFPTETSTMIKTKKQIWTTLCGKDRKREMWEVAGFFRVAESLMERLLRKEDLPRKKFKELFITQDASDKSMFPNESMNITDMDESALEAEVVEPMFRLGGVDCFRNENPEERMADHSFLISNGLRSKPMLLVNLMLPWANILVYFELPGWFTDFDNLAEKDEDAEDVKAVKRFLSGDTEYQKKRLVILPVVVSAPRAIMLFVPKKKEMTIRCRSIPTNFVKHPRKELADGSELCPCLELEIDIRNTFSRMTSMVRGYFKSGALDGAFVISEPTDPPTDNVEPTACLGFFQLNRIDVDRCPYLPERDRMSIGEESRDTIPKHSE